MKELVKQDMLQIPPNTYLEDENADGDALRHWCWKSISLHA